MTPEQLKTSIIHYAIQGKLVEQRPEEGTADEFYQRIQHKKQQLIKDGIIKKDKINDEISADEYPFDIPESWKWVYLRDIAYINGGYAFKSTNYTTEGVRVVRISDFNEEGFVNTKIVRHPYSDDLKPYLLGEKDILLCMTGGTVGKSYFVEKLPEKMMTNQRVATIKCLCDINEYVNYVILSPITQNVIQLSKNSTNDNISMDTINGFFIPLPPEAEMTRIINRLKEVLPFVNRYAEAYEKLEQFNAKFPEDMKKSILQYAIQGKLVEQRPEEGTAEDLYEKVQKEKQKLIKEGKIKKDQSTEVITDDAIPFEIPLTWKWVRLNDLVRNKPTNGYSPKGVDYETPYKNLTLTATTSGYFKSECYKFIDITEEEAEKYWVKNNDILIQRSNSRELVGTSCIYTDKDNQFIYPDLMMRIHLLENIDVKYLDYVLKSPMVKGYFSKNATGTSDSMPKINQTIVSLTLIPLPPFLEQKRIVSKLEELLPYCNLLTKMSLN